MILVDTNCGKVEVKTITTVNEFGETITATLYKPKTATAENPAPVLLSNHGGGDCREQQSSYNVEFARRGYVVISWDASGCGGSEVTSGDATMGGEAIFALMNTLDYVDHNKVITEGHSMGGIYSMTLAQRHQDQVVLQVNIGMNMYGNADLGYGFNFALIMGLADESGLSRVDNNIYKLMEADSLKAVFAITENVVPGKAYGNFADETGRTVYMPDSIHAYYLVNKETVTNFLEVADKCVPMPIKIDINNQVWQWKDVGMALVYAGLVVFMFVIAAMLLDSKLFEGLKLPELKNVGFEEKTPKWYIAFAILAIIPAITYLWGFKNYGKIKFWLMGGSPNGYILWGWATAALLLVFFLAFHFIFGKKNGGNARTYGFATTQEGNGFSITYILKAAFYGIAVVGLTYILYMLVYAFTKSGLHITTFMMLPVQQFRGWAFVVYFLFQIPYFLLSGLSARSVNLNNGDKTSAKSMTKSIALGAVINMSLLFVMYLVFVIALGIGHTNILMNDRLYIAAIAILPLMLSLLAANAVNVYITNKTNSVYAGLFTALLWSTWLMVGANAIAIM